MPSYASQRRDRKRRKKEDRVRLIAQLMSLLGRGLASHQRGQEQAEYKKQQLEYQKATLEGLPDLRSAQTKYYDARAQAELAGDTKPSDWKGYAYQVLREAGLGPDATPQQIQEAFQSYSGVAQRPEDQESVSDTMMGVQDFREKSAAERQWGAEASSKPEEVQAILQRLLRERAVQGAPQGQQGLPGAVTPDTGAPGIQGPPMPGAVNRQSGVQSFQQGQPPMPGQPQVTPATQRPGWMPGGGGQDLGMVQADRSMLADLGALYKSALNPLDPNNMSAMVRLDRLFATGLPLDVQAQSGGLGGPMQG